MIYKGINIFRNEGPGYKLRYWALTDSGKLAANTIADMKHLISGLERIAAKEDRRYTRNKEFCGEKEARIIVRFCGEWVAKAKDLDDAIEIIMKHKKARTG